MPAYKVVMFFNVDDQGWTETYYWQHPTFGEASLRDDIADLEKARRAILGNDVLLKGIRYTDITPIIAPAIVGRITHRPSVIWRNRVKGVQRGTATDITYNPWMAWLANLYDVSDTYRRSLLIRGLPRKFVQWDSTNTTNPALDTTFEPGMTAFLKALGVRFPPQVPNSISRWKLQGRDKTSPAAARLDITDVTTVSPTDKRFRIRISDVVSWQIGDIVHVHGVTACTAKGINGDSVVTEVGASIGGSLTLTLAKKQCCEGAILYDGKATAYKVLRTVFASISKCSQGRYVNRKTGRAFFSTRGRQRKRCCN